MSALSTLGFLVSSAPSFQLLSHPLHCAAEEAGAIAEQVFHNQLTRITIQGLEEAKHMEPDRQKWQQRKIWIISQ